MKTKRYQKFLAICLSVTLALSGLPMAVTAAAEDCGHICGGEACSYAEDTACDHIHDDSCGYWDDSDTATPANASSDRVATPSGAEKPGTVYDDLSLP